MTKIYTTTIACKTNAWGGFDYAVHIYNRDFVLRGVKVFADEAVATTYAERFWSFTEAAHEFPNVR